MNPWFISFFTGIVSIIALYYSMQLKNLKIQIPAIIAFSLLLMGETIDLLAGIAFDSLLLFFAEILEMFITVGFFSLIYYINLQRKKNNSKGKKK